MCEPVTIATVGLAIVSAYISYDQHENQVKQYNQQQQAMAAEQDYNNESAKMEQDATSTQAQQMLRQRTEQAQRDMALASTVAGEYGGGNTANRNLTAIGLGANEDLADIRANRDSTEVQIARDAANNDSLASYQMAAANRPSAAAAGLSIVSTGVQGANTGVKGYETYQRAKAAYEADQNPSPK